jgi:spore coat protein SA
VSLERSDYVIYHLLPEWEVFSVYSGGAIAADVAAIMRFSPPCIVVCRSADNTFGYTEDQILLTPWVRPYARIRGKGHFPTWVTGSFFRYAFNTLLHRLNEGDIVWCHSEPAFCAALEPTIHEKGAKLIHHVHNVVTPTFVHSKFRDFTADATIFVSEATRQEAFRFLPQLNNTFVVYNGADETLFYPSSMRRVRTSATPVILYVGRLDPVKGVHVLMAAMRILQQRKVNVLCKVIGSSQFGDGKATSYVTNLLKIKPSNVEFQSYRSCTEIPKAYRSADIFCCPSIWEEPFGKVNIEAMASEIPVVASRVGGIPEIAADGGVYLVEPNSAVELADALQTLLENEDLRRKIGAEGLRSFRRRFTWATIVKQLMEIIGNL